MLSRSWLGDLDRLARGLDGSVEVTRPHRRPSDRGQSPALLVRIADPSGEGDDALGLRSRLIEVAQEEVQRRPGLVNSHGVHHTRARTGIAGDLESTVIERQRLTNGEGLGRLFRRLGQYWSAFAHSADSAKWCASTSYCSATRSPWSSSMARAAAP